jgi:hypothetical protein
VAFVIVDHMNQQGETEEQFDAIESALREVIDHDAPLLDIEDDRELDVLELIDRDH